MCDALELQIDAVLMTGDVAVVVRARRSAYGRHPRAYLPYPPSLKVQCLDLRAGREAMMAAALSFLVYLSRNAFSFLCVRRVN